MAQIKISKETALSKFAVIYALWLSSCYQDESTKTQPHKPSLYLGGS